MARRRGVLAEIQRERRLRQREHDRQRRQAIQDAARVQRAQEKRESQARRQAAANEAALRQLIVQERRADAAARTAEIEARIAELASVLGDGLRDLPGVSLDALRRDVPLRAFDPAGLNRPRPEPRWEDYAPDRPGVLQRLVSSARHRAEEAARRQEYEQALAEHAAATLADRQQLARRHHAYDRYVKEATKLHVTEIRGWEEQFLVREPEAVARFFTMALESSDYPEGFPKRTPVIGYDPASQHLVVDIELPHREIIPTERGYRYIQTRQETDVVQRPVREVRERYQQLICQVALRTIHTIIAADPAGVLELVTFNGRLSTIDKATGKPDRPYLLSVPVTQEEFGSLVLSQVDPIACVKRLGARMSPHPYDLEEVKPHTNTEAFLAQFNFVEGADVIAGLDTRPDLLDLSPWDFETFVRDLFTAMGLKAWKTQDVKDDGVDAVAINEDPVFGGKCVIQAKRYTKAVPPAAIRELMGSMADKHATKGILVTTSWVGPKGVEQAERDGRIDIINCHNLKQLCHEHLDLDILISLPTQPPPPRRSNDIER